MKAGYFLLGVFSAIAGAYANSGGSFDMPIGVKPAQAVTSTALDPNGFPTALKVDKDGKVIAHCE